MLISLTLEIMMWIDLIYKIIIQVYHQIYTIYVWMTAALFTWLDRFIYIYNTNMRNYVVRCSWLVNSVWNNTNDTGYQW